MADEQQYWRNFFGKVSSDVFEVIEKAILVAATDHPEELRSRRDQIEALLQPRSDPVEDIGGIRRIKEMLLNGDEISDDVLLESLRRLQQMRINVDILKETEIGKAVNSIRKSNKPKKILQLARTIIKSWRVLVDEWINGNAASTESCMLVDTQGGPPPQNDMVMKTCSASAATEQKIAPQRKPLTVVEDASNNADDRAREAKLEISKRKLHEGYQRAENAKRQRTIKILELSEIPKQKNLKVNVGVKLQSSRRR